MTDGLDRLKVLINSSTPIIVMETSEETHAVNLVRAACTELNMATFEWTIADGLLRSGTNTPPEPAKIPLQARIDQNPMLAQAGRAYSQVRTALSPGPRGSRSISPEAMSSYQGADGGGAGAPPVRRSTTRASPRRLLRASFQQQSSRALRASPKKPRETW